MFCFFKRFYYIRVLKTTENAEDTEKYFKSNDTYLTIINRIKPMSENPGQQLCNILIRRNPILTAVNIRCAGNKAYIMASGIFTFNGKEEIAGGDSGIFMTLDKASRDSQDNSIIESIDDVKEQFIQIIEELKKEKDDNFKERLNFIDKYVEWIKARPNKVWSKQYKEFIDSAFKKL